MTSKSVFASAFLIFLLFSFSPLAAQEKTIEFDDGTTMSFEMLKQDPTIPIPLYVGLGLRMNLLAPGDLFAPIALGLNASYFINPDLMLAGSGAYRIGGFSTFNTEESNFSHFELGAFYSFANKVKIKKGSLKLKSASTGYNQTTNYMYRIKEPTLRSWDVYLGLGAMDLSSEISYEGAGIANFGLEDVTRLKVIGESITTLELGISTRKFTRDVFMLDGKVRGQSKTHRWTAKIMLPILTRASVLEITDDPAGFVLSEELKEGVDYFNDQWTGLGYGIFYEGIVNAAMTPMNFMGGYSFGLAMYPFIDAVPMLSFGYTLGFGLNDPNQLLD